MLHFRFSKKLRDFTLEISEELGNETLVLIGHSGCGKSTTLKILAGLIDPDEGEIQFNKKQLYSSVNNTNLAPENRNIGFVFQNYALFPHLTVRENIAYGISKLPIEEKERRIQEALSFLEIESLANSKPILLSGGEQQRVALARALVTQPTLLLLDEPLSALDVSTRSHVRAELKQVLSRLSIPSIIVTHDYEDARVLADKVAVMDRGQVVQTGAPKEIHLYPVNQFVAEFTGTNLVSTPSENGENSIHVAFDPWKVKITRNSSGKPYEWQGQIKDAATLGGFIRLHIEGSSCFQADIPIETFEQENFQIGDFIYASVEKKDIREVTSTQVTSASQETEPYELKKSFIEQSKKKKKKWQLAYLFAIFVFVSFMATSYGFNSKPVSNQEKIEMFSLVAANATDPFNELMEEFSERHPEVKMEATFAGTQVIRTQLEQGAKADIFLSADYEHIEAVQKQGLVEEFFPVSQNRVVIVIPKEDKIGIRSLEDLGKKKVKLVIGTDSVPIGKYTRQIFDKAEVTFGDDFAEKVIANVVSFETNVKQVLQKVALGEAEAGLVYVTDVTPDFLKRVNVIEIPREHNVVATNYIAVPTKAPQKELAEAFMQMMLSEEGQKIFEKYKYESVK